MLKFLPVLLLLVTNFCFAQAAPESSPKEWTVYIHMNGNNNLCPFTKVNLNQLKSKDVSKNANIIVAYACNRLNDSRLIELTGAKEKDLLPRPQQFDMGDYKFFRDTATAVFKRYPSKKRMIVLWNHGSGWELKKTMPARGISYDDQSGNHISTPQLGLALQEISAQFPVDILGFDACLMQMAEVLYEYADYAKYTVASEDLEPGEGWDYTGMLKALDSSASPKQMGMDIVDAYLSYYEQTGQSVTLSVVDHAKLIPLTEEIRNLARSLNLTPGLKSIVDTLPTWYDDYKDLGTFLDKLPLEQASVAKDLYSQTVVYSKATEAATGLSVYLTPFPRSDYKDLKFSKATGWFDFIRQIK